MKKRGMVEGFSQRLYFEWLRSGLSQREVAKRIGFERKSISAWIHGDSTPSILALARLCALFHVSADYILFGKKRRGGVNCK